MLTLPLIPQTDTVCSDLNFGRRGVARLKSPRPALPLVMPRKGGHAGASRVNHWRLWNTGSPAFAGDDSA